MKFKRNETLLEVRDFQGRKRPKFGEVFIWLEIDLQVQTPHGIIVLKSDVDPHTFTTVDAFMIKHCCYSWRRPAWVREGVHSYASPKIGDPTLNYKIYDCEKCGREAEIHREGTVNILYSKLIDGEITGIVNENVTPVLSEWFASGDSLEGIVNGYEFLREFEKFINFIHPRLATKLG